MRNILGKWYRQLNIGRSAIAFAIGWAAFVLTGCNSDGDDGNPAVAGNIENSGGSGGSTAAGASGGPSSAGTGGSSGSGSVQGGTGGTVAAGTGGGVSEQSGGAGAAGIMDSGLPDGSSAGAGESGGTGGPEPTAGTGGAPEPTGGTGAPASTLPPVDNVDADGPFATAPEDLASGPRGTSGVFRPADLGQNGIKHPIFIWSCGGGTAPNLYIWHMNRIASHGFVVVADDAPNDASGSKIIASMDWIIGENDRSDSPFYQKLDTTMIGIGGHSMGSLNSLEAASDPRVKTTVLVCGGGMGAGGASRMHAPVLFLGGVGEGGTINFEGDYEATPTPAVFLIKEATDHIMCARNNIAPWVAWLRWQLAGETKYTGDFLEASGVYCNSPWTCQSKNF